MIFFDYSACDDDTNYFGSLKQFDPLSAVLTKILHDMEDEGVPPVNIHMYGFSLGARIAIEAAINFGPGKVGSIDGKNGTLSTV